MTTTSAEKSASLLSRTVSTAFLASASRHRRVEGRSRSGGAPVEQSAVFKPLTHLDAGPPRIGGFCNSTNASAPVCKEEGCCCWSTFGMPSHPAYENRDEAEYERLCLNPPKGFQYVTVPGELNDRGELIAMKFDQIPKYDGRDLCCTVNEHDVYRYSNQEHWRAPVTNGPTPAVTDAPTTTAMPTTLGVPPVDKGMDDLETLEMEKAANDDLASAQTLITAANSLGTSVDDLHAALEAQGRDPRLAIHKANSAALRKALERFVKKEKEASEKLQQKKKQIG